METSYRILSKEEVERVVEIVGSDLVNTPRVLYPSINCTVQQLIVNVRHRLELAHVQVRDIRLTGCLASSVFAGSDTAFNTCRNVELLFQLVADGQTTYDLDVLAEEAVRGAEDLVTSPYDKRSLRRMMTVTRCPSGSMSGDLWTRVTMNCRQGRHVNMLFAVTLTSQLDFSVDSLEIRIETLIMYLMQYDKLASGFEHFYPSLAVYSRCGDVRFALRQVANRILFARAAHELRDQSLLRYCHLRTAGFSLDSRFDEDSVEQAVCTRFLIENRTVASQERQIDTYMTSYLSDANATLRDKWLDTLRDVIKRGLLCVDKCCLIELTEMIDSLQIYDRVVNSQQQRVAPKQQQQQQQLVNNVTPVYQTGVMQIYQQPNVGMTRHNCCSADERFVPVPFQLYFRRS